MLTDLYISLKLQLKINTKLEQLHYRSNLTVLKITKLQGAHALYTCVRQPLLVCLKALHVCARQHIIFTIISVLEGTVCNYVLDNTFTIISVLEGTYACAR